MNCHGNYSESTFTLPPFVYVLARARMCARGPGGWCVFMCVCVCVCAHSFEVALLVGVART